MKFLYFILFSTLLVSSSIAQVEDRRTREEQQRISERERRIKQIKAVFNQ
ncbi:MAG: hypothetical protein RL206_754, partial [Bacteroidota bacterium]